MTCGILCCSLMFYIMLFGEKVNVRLIYHPGVLVLTYFVSLCDNLR